MTDHFKLICFCHNTRLAHLNRNLPPTTMAKQACGAQTVANEVLAKGTGNRSASWTPPPLFPFRRSTCSQSNTPFRKRKIGAGCSLPPQSRVTRRLTVGARVQLFPVQRRCSHADRWRWRRRQAHAVHHRPVHQVGAGPVMFLHACVCALSVLPCRLRSLPRRHGLGRRRNT